MAHSFAHVAEDQNFGKIITMDFVHFKPEERHHRFYNCRYVCTFVQFSGKFISLFLINARGGTVG